jgi:hypothetical protein
VNLPAQVRIETTEIQFDNEDRSFKGKKQHPVGRRDKE